MHICKDAPVQKCRERAPAVAVILLGVAMHGAMEGVIKMT